MDSKLVLSPLFCINLAKIHAGYGPVPWESEKRLVSREEIRVYGVPVYMYVSATRHQHSGDCRYGCLRVQRHIGDCFAQVNDYMYEARQEMLLPGVLGITREEITLLSYAVLTDIPSDYHVLPSRPW